MLRIERHSDHVLIQLWSGVGSQPAPKRYELTPERAIWLHRQLDLCYQQNRLESYPATPDRPYSIYIMRPKPHYRVVNGTSYDERTPALVIEALESARQNGLRLRFYYGDSLTTGQAWGNVETGYIGRSTGPVKIPLCVYNARSIGGGGLLDYCIVKLEYANKKDGGLIWQHPHFQPSDSLDSVQVE